MECNEEILDAESNILLKRTFGEFVGFMNAEDYFMKIENKVKDLKLSKSEWIILNDKVKFENKYETWSAWFIWLRPKSSINLLFQFT